MKLLAAAAAALLLASCTASAYTPAERTHTVSFSALDVKLDYAVHTKYILRDTAAITLPRIPR